MSLALNSSEAHHINLNSQTALRSSVRSEIFVATRATPFPSPVGAAGIGRGPAGAAGHPAGIGGTAAGRENSSAGLGSWAAGLGKCPDGTGRWVVKIK